MLTTPFSSPSVTRGFARCVAFLPLMLTSLVGALKAQDFEGKIIADVEIRYTGPKTVDETRLRNLMSCKAGVAYTRELDDKDVKALYASGLVDDVNTLVEDPTADKLRLIVQVKTRAEYLAIGFVGNTVFKDQKLAKESKLKNRGILSDELIYDAVRNLEKYYHDSGYPDASAVYKMQPSGQPGKVDLVFVITEGSKNEVRKIRFEGNKAFSSHDLLKEMKVKPKDWLSWITHDNRFEKDKLEADLNAILDYYHSRGFLRATSPDIIRRVPAGGGLVDLVIPINEGERYTVAAVSFGKMTVFKPAELYPALTLVAGSAYSSKKMRADDTMIRSYYGSRGYADAAVKPDIGDAGPNRVSITYRVTEGTKFRVGRVNIKGNSATKEKVIRRESTLKPSEWFNSVELETTRDRLKNLGYFGDVSVKGVPTGGGYRDVDILVEEKRTGKVNVGVGFSSIDSIMGILTVEQPNFDLFKPWDFRGGGQRFAMNLREGTTRTDFSMSLVEPFFLDQKLSLGGDVFYRMATNLSDYYDQTNAGAAIFLRKPLDNLNLSSLRLEYRLEQVSIDDPSSDHHSGDYNYYSYGNYYVPDVPPPAPLNTSTSKLINEDGSPREQGDYLRSAVTLNYLYDSRDTPIQARSGHKVDVGVTLAGGILGGDVETITISAQAQKHWNLKWDSILSISGELASVDSLNGDEVPIFERMFLGGGRQLRGFEFRDVGPRDTPGTTGEVIGGNSLGYVSFEYTVPVPVLDMVRAAVFYDMGFVNTSSWDLSPSDLYGDVGIGLRVKLSAISPLPLALDYAIPVMSPDREADKGGQFNFYMLYQY
ncbi:MAG: outer membrane protein assembly factor BamA [Verrucomicrobia bacterium]|nr:outer membrane protein assembly factor BamA [Verrucomicrobiota bacterium]